jgi:hypothetical protein
MEPLTVVLQNGMLLLFGSVDPGTRSLGLRFDGGRVARIVPIDGVFSIVLRASDAVRTITPDIPGRDVSCTLPRRGMQVEQGYVCDDRVGPQSPPPLPAPPFPGVPAPSGSLGTAPSIPAAS